MNLEKHEDHETTNTISDPTSLNPPVLVLTMVDKEKQKYPNLLPAFYQTFPHSPQTTVIGHAV